MSSKPTYLGLLNAVAVAELGGESLFKAWAAVTPNEEVRALLQTVALREAEHAREGVRLEHGAHGVRRHPEPVRRRPALALEIERRQRALRADPFEHALGYRFDIVVSGRDATPVEA